jgi:chemotaxis protein histidine kinase CheA
VDAGKQQQILGYFLEEAKEHLETLEKGFLELQATVTDQERVNELFRAAHSVKGGAAMLGFNSIQQISHRLEDCLKILKENQIKVDPKIEALFLKGYDALKDLLERLQGPFGLREEEGDRVVQETEPAFTQLQDYLNSRIAGGASDEAGTDASIFGDQVVSVLKQMLQLFKQKETPASRQQLQKLCAGLAKMDAGAETWLKLVKTAHKAISHPQHSYAILAPFVIKELKQASDLVVVGKAEKIAPSYSLQQLAAGAPAAGLKQVVVVVEPKAAAKTLIQAFSKEQLVQLVQLLHKATK